MLSGSSLDLAIIQVWFFDISMLDLLYGKMLKFAELSNFLPSPKNVFGSKI